MQPWSATPGARPKCRFGLAGSLPARPGYGRWLRLRRLVQPLRSPGSFRRGHSRFTAERTPSRKSWRKSSPRRRRPHPPPQSPRPPHPLPRQPHPLPRRLRPHPQRKPAASQNTLCPRHTQPRMQRPHTRLNPDIPQRPSAQAVTLPPQASARKRHRQQPQGRRAQHPPTTPARLPHTPPNLRRPRRSRPSQRPPLPTALPSRRLPPPRTAILRNSSDEAPGPARSLNLSGPGRTQLFARAPG